jgi:ubiquinol-cytochrome c reductase cytochrome b subunit
MTTFKKLFYTKQLLAKQRIETHNEEVISTIVGNLLGDGWAEKRENKTRFHIHMGSANVEYLNWLHEFFCTRGYCSTIKPTPIKQIGKKGKIYFSYKFRTWSYSSFNWLYDLFYDSTRKKRIPPNILQVLTPRALAIWLMDDGGVSGQGVKIKTEGFSFSDIEILQNSLKTRYLLITTIHCHKDKWILYFPKSELLALSKIVKPYMIPSMYYKLNN